MTPSTSPPEDVDRASSASRRLPGGRVVMAATGVVLLVGLAEVLVVGRIGLWTGVTLVFVAVVAPLVTRPGDRSLAAMMPPLAFVLTVLSVGQLLVIGEPGDLRARELLTMVDTLGGNAAWVVAATLAATSIAAIGHLVDRRHRHRAQPPAPNAPAGSAVRPDLFSSDPAQG